MIIFNDNEYTKYKKNLQREENDPLVENIKLIKENIKLIKEKTICVKWQHHKTQITRYYGR